MFLQTSQDFSVVLILSGSKHPNHPICEATPTPTRRRLRMVLEHPLSKRLSLYGMNGGTCRVLPKEAQKTHGLSESCHGVKIAMHLVS